MANGKPESLITVSTGEGEEGLYEIPVQGTISLTPLISKYVPAFAYVAALGFDSPTSGLIQGEIIGQEPGSQPQSWTCPSPFITLLLQTQK